MFKILTIVFFTYYLINIFKQHHLIMGVFSSYTDEIKEIILKKQTTNLSTSDKNTSSYVLLGLLLLIYFVFQFIEFVYVIIALGHDPYKYPSFAFLAFWIIILVVGIVKKDTFNPTGDLSKYSVDGAIEELDKFKIKATKYQIKVLLQHLIDIAFFGYMIYILFLL